MNELATRNHTALTPQSFLQEWNVLKEQANVLVKSGFLPTNVNTPEKAIAIMMKGKEVGMHPMQALSQINIIQGRPTISAEGMMAMVLKHYPDTKIRYLQSTNDICEMEVVKPGGKPEIWKFSMEDAKKADLSSKDMWKKYPRSMLRSRCISEMCRAVFPDAIQGCSYTPEEMRDAISELVVEQEPKEAPKPLQIVSTQPIVVSSQPVKALEIFDAENVEHVRSADSFLGAGEKHLHDIVCGIMHGKEKSRKNLMESIMEAKRKEITLEL